MKVTYDSNISTGVETLLGKVYTFIKWCSEFKGDFGNLFHRDLEGYAYYHVNILRVIDCLDRIEKDLIYLSVFLERVEQDNEALKS